MANRKGRFETI